MAKFFFRAVGLAAALIVAALGSIMASDTPPALSPSPPAYLDIVDAELEVDDEVEMELRLAGDAAGGVPGNAYGYAALTADGTGLLAVTTHIGIDDTSAELDETGFHTHVAALTTVTGCASGIQVASASFDPIGELEVDGPEVEVEDAPSDVLGAFTGFIVSFTLTVEGGAICVNPADVFPEDLCGMTVTEDLELDRDLSCAADGLIVGADGIEIELNGHTISGSGTDPNSAGIRISGRTGVSIEGPGVVTKFRTGVLIESSSDISVEEVTAIENGFAAPSAAPFPLSKSDGIHVTTSRDVVLEDNTAAKNADDGINLHLSTDVRVEENVVDDNLHDGIRLDVADGNVLEENFVASQDLILPTGARVGCGIEIFGSKDNTIEENTVVGSHHGIRLRATADGTTASTGNIVEENEVDGTGAAGGALRGIHLVGSSTQGNLVEENTVTNLEAGIAFTGGTPTGNTFEENKIVSNTCGVQGPIAGNTFEDNKFKNNGSDFCP